MELIIICIFKCLEIVNKYMSKYICELGNTKLTSFNERSIGPTSPYHGYVSVGLRISLLYPSFENMKMVKANNVYFISK